MSEWTQQDPTGLQTSTLMLKPSVPSQLHHRNSTEWTLCSLLLRNCCMLIRNTVKLVQIHHADLSLSAGLRWRREMSVWKWDSSVRFTGSICLWDKHTHMNDYWSTAVMHMFYDSYRCSLNCPLCFKFFRMNCNNKSIQQTSLLIMHWILFNFVYF